MALAREMPCVGMVLHHIVVGIVKLKLALDERQWGFNCDLLWNVFKTVLLKENFCGGFSLFRLIGKTGIVEAFQQQAGCFTEPTKAIASMPPGLCPGALEMLQ